MPKKQWTAEERAAFAAKMKAARANKQQPTVEDTVTEDKIELPARDLTEAPKETLTNQEDVQALINYIKELEAQNWRAAQAGPTPTAQVDARGRLVGTVEKFSMDPARYPSPAERLAQEPKLARFAFPLNYELKYSVSESAYTTIDGVRTREPKFTLELIRIMLDDATGEDTGGRYVVCRLIMHEDPDTAVMLARENGIVVEDWEETAFLNEMRYLRMRDWLLERFYPQPIRQDAQKAERVIDGRLVEFYEVSSTTPKSIPFDQLARY